MLSQQAGINEKEKEQQVQRQLSKTRTEVLEDSDLDSHVDENLGELCDADWYDEA